jgi:manganese-dependent inorganic pyrophosphatase
MPKRTFVIGHKDPDTDSIVSAVAYAELLRLQGHDHVVAARQGSVWPETCFILERFGLPLPVLVEDVRPRARDVMTTDPIVANADDSADSVGRRLRAHRIRATSIVDSDHRLAGLIPVEDFAHILLTGLDRDHMDQIHLDVKNVVETLGGRLIFEAHARRLRDKALVAAMHLESVRSRVEPDIMMVIGDRLDAQRAAIEEGAGALVITGGLPISSEIERLVRERSVTLISSPHHTFTTVHLLNLSFPISHILRRDVLTASVDESPEDLRDKIALQRTIPIVNTSQRPVGIVSRSDLINPVRHSVYLVDHNERSQTVAGLEEAELRGIVDHHRIADIQSAGPIFFSNEILGSTSAIIVGLYDEAGIAIPSPIAGILSGGLIADTVLLRSPTITPRDKLAANELATIARVDVDGFGNEIFAVASDLSGTSARDILTTDCKEYRIEDTPFAVAYIETLHKRRVDESREALLAEMTSFRGERGYASLLLMVVDIVYSQTQIPVVGMEDAVATALDQPLASAHSIMVGGVMSRKKQVIPALPRVARAWRQRA